MKTLAPLLVLLFACDSAAEPTKTPPATTPPAKPAPKKTTVQNHPPVELTWTLARDGQQLVVEYSARNTSKETVWLADQLPLPGSTAKWKLGADRIIVMPDPDDADVVLLVRARVKSTTNLPKLADPATRELVGGATITGRAIVPLPLKSWHYRGHVAAITGEPKRAQLRIGVLTGKPHLQKIEFEDGTSMMQSYPGDPMLMASSNVIAIP
jgi:hypothetical protein